MKRCILMFATLLIGFAGSAYAEGPYIGANIGLGIVHDSDINTPGAAKATLEYNTGLALDVAIGFKFKENWRAEGEFGYLSADIDKFNGVSVGGSNDITATPGEFMLTA